MIPLKMVVRLQLWVWMEHLSRYSVFVHIRVSEMREHLGKCYRIPAYLESQEQVDTVTMYCTMYV